VENEERIKVLLSREEAFLRTQTFHSIGLQLDDACQQAMHRLMLYAAGSADASGENETKTKSIQQTLDTLFQETSAAVCRACLFSTLR
jgi:hypothetical protein